jgi:urease accessory protein
MSIVERVIGHIDTLSPRPGRIDLVMLTSEERASAHMVAHSEGGRSIRLSLPRGTELNDGDVLAVEGDTALVVGAAMEDLFFVSPRDAYQAGVAGYQLGNLHRPVRFTEAALLTPADPVVADLLKRLGIAFEVRRAPFIGQRYGAYAGHHHGPAGHDHQAHGPHTHTHASEPGSHEG